MTLASNILTAGVALLFGAWLIASLPNQFRWRWWDRVARYDQLGLLPRWTFFAPNPGRHDVHVIYCDIIEAQIGTWQEIDHLSSPMATRWLWSPDRFGRKAVTDAANAVVRAAGQHEASDARAIQLDPAYLQILCWVQNDRQESIEGTLCQFALVRTQLDLPGRPLNILFVSFDHPVPFDA